MGITGGVVEAVVELRAPGTAAPSDPLAVLILGPTGSGKTALSLALGERFGGEVVSCDSVAVYRGMDLGSAKPSLEERSRLPHHLIDVADPDTAFTAGEYARQARVAMREIAGRAHVPLVTGGTGLYLRALTMGLFAGPARQEELRARLTRSETRFGAGWLHRVLTRVDPVSAGRIHSKDVPKLIRALEVWFATGRPLSATLGAGPEVARDLLTGFRLLRIGLNPPRKELYARLNERASAMFSAGLVEEARELVERFGRVKALDALGYRQALAVVDGSLTVEEAVAAAQQGHRNFAKRQLTWFRREPEVHWIEDFGDSKAGLEKAIALVEGSLHSSP
jgi:tRNA dimethylallyltransferase